MTLASTMATTPIVLDITKKADVIGSFTWNNPNYKFTTGVSSQNVTYTLQVDVAGNNFKNPQEKVVVSDLSTSVTVGELNTLLLSRGLDFGVAQNIEMRLRATLNGITAAPVYSNVLAFVVTPYLDVKFPVPTNLYITGSATPASWQCGCGEAENTSQKFTKVNAYTFELTLALSANNSYLFLPVYGSWSAKYGFTGGGNANNQLDDEFKPEGNDIKSPGEAGTYKITVDFKTGRFKLVKQ
ncbi:MAG: hypothetical protein EOO88_48870 [Pedobacter sp.]|nr:MAG: hypothetical protein EOO88_48870 [Pedobacter sp.]